MAARAMNHPNITVLWNTAVTTFVGDAGGKKLRAIVLQVRSRWRESRSRSVREPL